MTSEDSRGVREHFGRGKLAIDPAKAVFINCPYDRDFESTFDAILFSTVCCGFMPRSAVESVNTAEARMSRILEGIFSSKYSIHDLSRCRGEGDEHLARFNMPLELGMAMARRYMTARKSERHDWLVLVPEGHGYLKFVSDLAGFDPIAIRRQDRVRGIQGDVLAGNEAGRGQDPDSERSALGAARVPGRESPLAS